MNEASRDSLEMALVHLRDAFMRVTYCNDQVEASILRNVIQQVQGIITDNVKGKR